MGLEFKRAGGFISTAIMRALLVKVKLFVLSSVEPLVTTGDWYQMFTCHALDVCITLATA